LTCPNSQPGVEQLHTRDVLRFLPADSCLSLAADLPFRFSLPLRKRTSSMAGYFQSGRSCRTSSARWRGDLPVYSPCSGARRLSLRTTVTHVHRRVGDENAATTGPAAPFCWAMGGAIATLFVSSWRACCGRCREQSALARRSPAANQFLTQGDQPCFRQVTAMQRRRGSTRSSPYRERSLSDLKNGATSACKRRAWNLASLQPCSRHAQTRTRNGGGPRRLARTDVSFLTHFFRSGPTARRSPCE